MKSKILLVLLGLNLVGCQTTNYQASEPTATVEDIQNLQQQFSDISDMSVTDEGVVKYSRWVPEGYKWDVVSSRKSAYQYSCVDALPLLEAGFIIEIHLKGKGGRIHHYDLNRCTLSSSDNM